MGINNCPLCLEKQRRIDDLKEEVKGLKRALRRRERKDEEGFFGSSTPSSKKPVKANVEKQERKPKGARQGMREMGAKGIKIRA